MRILWRTWSSHQRSSQSNHRDRSHLRPESILGCGRLVRLPGVAELPLVRSPLRPSPASGVGFDGRKGQGGS
jgi:hypothetical protein